MDDPAVVLSAAGVEAESLLSRKLGQSWRPTPPPPSDAAYSACPSSLSAKKCSSGKLLGQVEDELTRSVC